MPWRSAPCCVPFPYPSDAPRQMWRVLSAFSSPRKTRGANDAVNGEVFGRTGKKRRRGIQSKVLFDVSVLVRNQNTRLFITYFPRSLSSSFRCHLSRLSAEASITFEIYDMFSINKPY